MRQRLAMAAALLGEPGLLLLDEPTASLDAESRGEFEHILVRLRDAGKTILLSTHMLRPRRGTREPRACPARRVARSSMARSRSLWSARAAGATW